MALTGSKSMSDSSVVKIEEPSPRDRSPNIFNEEDEKIDYRHETDETVNMAVFAWGTQEKHSMPVQRWLVANPGDLSYEYHICDLTGALPKPGKFEMVCNSTENGEYEQTFNAVLAALKPTENKKHPPRCPLIDVLDELITATNRSSIVMLGIRCYDGFTYSDVACRILQDMLNSMLHPDGHRMFNCQFFPMSAVKGSEKNL